MRPLCNYLMLVLLSAGCAAAQSFQLMETTVADVHKAYKSGKLTARQLTRMYLDRIEAYDRNGPRINSVITINPKALEEADRLDAAYKSSGPVGPLHGIPIVLKDQMDVAGIPTTLGAIVMKDNVPVRDSFVVEKLKKAGAIMLAKVTLGEMGGGDTFDSLFGETRNPYDPERTVGGSSGGTGAAVSAAFRSETALSNSAVTFLKSSESGSLELPMDSRRMPMRAPFRPLRSRNFV